MLEYDIGAKVTLNKSVVEVACRIEPVVVGCIEPMLVVCPLRFVFGRMRKATVIWRGRMSKVFVIRPFRFVLRSKRRLEIRRVEVSRDVRVGDIYKCEGIFAMRKYVREILSVVSNRTERDLEEIYTTLGWSKTLDSLEDILSSPPTFAITPDLINGLRDCLGVMNHFFWMIQNPYVLAPTWRYPNGWCWAVVLIRQFEALLKVNKLLEPHVFLSVQDLINQVPKELRTAEGDVHSLFMGEHALLRGVTTEQFCPLGSAQRIPGAPVFRLKNFTVIYDNDYSAAGWDGMIDEELSVAPFSACVFWFDSYIDIIASEEMYKPTEDERKKYVLNHNFSHLSVHAMLLTGKGIDENGAAFLQFQDTTSGDLNNGDRGFLRFARYDPCSVFEIIHMELLPASEYVQVN